MKVLVTGSAGHLGEALVRTLRAVPAMEVVGIDVLESPFTDGLGSIADREFVGRWMTGVDGVLHAATLHKPHVASHTRQQFVDTNVTGTLTLLEAAVAAGVRAFVMTSTTSVFGMALRPPPERPAVWVTEHLQPVPRNIYGVTKAAAEDVCELIHRQHGLACVVLRTSRFFPEADDDAVMHAGYAGDNLKANELLYRRVDVADVVEAHRLAVTRARDIGFGRFIISATTPFREEDVAAVRTNLPAVLDRRVPGWRGPYDEAGWKMLPGIDRIYDNVPARDVLGWAPRYDFAHVLECLGSGADYRSPLAVTIGSKGYHRLGSAGIKRP